MKNVTIMIFGVALAVTVGALAPNALARDLSKGGGGVAQEAVSASNDSEGSALGALDGALGLIPSEIYLNTAKGNAQNMVSAHKGKSQDCDTPPCRSGSQKSSEAVAMCDTPPCRSGGGIQSASGFNAFCDTPPCILAAKKASECDRAESTSGFMGCWTDWCSKTGNQRSPFCKDWNRNINSKVITAVSEVERHRERRLNTTGSSSTFKPENRLIEAEEDQRAVKAKQRAQAADEGYYYYSNGERQGSGVGYGGTDGGTAHNVSD